MKSHLIVAVRRLLRHKSITVINLLGLSLGMCVTFILLFYVFNEFSYDNFHENKDRIYRITTNRLVHGWKTGSTPYPLAASLEEEYPEIVKTTHVGYLMGTSILKDRTPVKESKFYCVDQTFFDIFTVDLMYGNPNKLLENPYDVVLTESVAEKYFNQKNVTGKQLTIIIGGEEITLNVSGVIKDLPVNSTLQFDFLGSMDLFLDKIGKVAFSGNEGGLTTTELKNSWGMDLLLTYVYVSEDFQPEQFIKKLADFEEKHLEKPENVEFNLQSIEDIYFHSGELLSSFTAKGNIHEVYIFLTIALLVLIVACINYILLGASQALTRSREICIRKITGATQKILFKQVLTESFITTVFAFFISLIFIEQARPFAVNFFGKEFLHYSIPGWKVLISFAVVLFLLSYIPSFFIVTYYTRVSPSTVIKGSMDQKSVKGGVQKSLMVFQFVVFLVLVSCSIGVYKQLNYSKTENQGYNTNNLVVFQLSNHGEFSKTFHILKEELLQHEAIISVGGAMWVPPTSNTMSFELSVPGSAEKSVSIDALYVEADFPEVMEIELKEGKYFSEFSENAKNIVLINETALEKLNIENPTGREIGGYEIVGVVRDFHYNSFHKKIPPMMLIKNNSNSRQMIVRYQDNYKQEVVSIVQEKYKNIAGPSSLNYEYLSDKFNRVYSDENKLVLFLTVFAGIAIGIASMGLVGLTIFHARKRSKEFAIRKVSGATTFNILKLLSGNYFKLLIISVVISFPLAFWILQRWLQNFVYQTTINWWLFGIAGIIAFIIIFLTISFQTIRAANRNPVESLRYE